MLSISITGRESTRERLQGVPEQVHQAIRAKVYTLTLLLEAHIKLNKLSGQVLKTQSGRLKRSIQSSVIDDGEIIRGRVFSTGDVPYAGIHEFGGRTSPHLISPVKAQALAFMYSGKLVFAKLVRHPGSVMPERSFMRSGLQDMRDQIVREMTDAVRGAM